MILEGLIVNASLKGAILLGRVKQSMIVVLFVDSLNTFQLLKEIPGSRLQRTGTESTIRVECLLCIQWAYHQTNHISTISSSGLTLACTVWHVRHVLGKLLVSSGVWILTRSYLPDHGLQQSSTLKCLGLTTVRGT